MRERKKKKRNFDVWVFNRIGTVCRSDIVCRIGIVYRIDSVCSMVIDVHQDVVLHDLLRDLSYRNDNVWLNRLNRMLLHSRIELRGIDCQSRTKINRSSSRGYSEFIRTMRMANKKKNLFQASSIVVFLSMIFFSVGIDRCLLGCSFSSSSSCFQCQI